MSAPLRQAVLAVTSVLALAVVCAVAWTPRPRAETPPAAERAQEPPASASEASGAPSDALPERNVFEFVDRPPAPPPAALPPLIVPPPLAPAAIEPAASEPIRLVGFVKRGGALRAALSLDGTVSVLGAGQEAGGYAVLSVDEDAGVTVRTPDGAELLLPPPQP